LDTNQVRLLADVDAISRIPAVINILEVICKTTEMGFAAVARVTEEHWMACAVNDQINFGLKPGEQLKLETTICHEIRASNEAVVIENVAEDPLYCGHPTPSIYGFQSYISVPITLKNGSFFGTLCAIDPNPHVINTPATLQMFKLFADLIAFHLDTMEQMAIAETSLLEERAMGDLREQFIAILGHDLRNPVGAISSAAQLLLRLPLDEKSLKLAKIIKDASYRTKGLIENILDFARGRLGDGIKLNRLENEPIEELLNEVIKELQLLWPNREIQINFNLNTAVCCDGRRIAQLFSNLLGNALTHGKSEAIITVEAKSNQEYFTLSISNPGEQISEAAMARLFQPFSRGEVKAGLEGLGLGLYISSEIARAHGGTLEVSSNEVETCFTLQLPNLPRPESQL
jgi:signal transduction histidine kinase